MSPVASRSVNQPGHRGGVAHLKVALIPPTVTCGIDFYMLATGLLGRLLYLPAPMSVVKVAAGQMPEEIKEDASRHLHLGMHYIRTSQLNYYY